MLHRRLRLVRTMVAAASLIALSGCIAYPAGYGSYPAGYGYGSYAVPATGYAPTDYGYAYTAPATEIVVPGPAYVGGYRPDNGGFRDYPHRGGYGQRSQQGGPGWDHEGPR